MKKPQSIEEAKALLWKRVDDLCKRRVQYRNAERDYFTAREWLAELEAKCAR